ncbi:MAG: adenosine kinase [Pseudomonadota bacterium]
MSSAPDYDIVAIGNAIVDIIGRCDDAFLEQHGADKGHMALVTAERISEIYGDMAPGIEISGGSAANTIVGAASLGAKTAYIGKVANDDFGKVFRHDIQAAGVTYETAPKSGGEATARSLVLVTPDGERTMNTFLGVSPELTSDDLDPKLISSGGILYLEGYLFDRPEAQAAFYEASKIAKDAGRRVALTLSDGFCVDRHRTAFRELINGPIDILFANETELFSLAEASDFDAAISSIARHVPLLAATRNAAGSVIVTNTETVTIPAATVETVVDTTGAGDLYAAGVLYGLSNNLPLETCGQLGSLAASEIISHIGARPESNLLDLAKEKGLIS